MKNIFDKHRLKIAKSTLRMSDSGALIMGGMSKIEARQFLCLKGWTDKRIETLENAIADGKV